MTATEPAQDGLGRGDADRRRLRATFGEDAELYDRARPSYPPSVYEELVQLASLERGGRVLEIGCGTGQATVALAERGLELTCVELGPELARVARLNLAGYANVRVDTTAFEVWAPPAVPFDAVVAFTAWHWLDPHVRYRKAASVLRAGGALAVVATRHVLRDGGDRFWHEVQEDYAAIAPSPDDRPPPDPSEVGDLRDEIDASGVFETMAVRRHLWDVSYDAEEYIRVLDTYSGHRSLDPATRAELYARIRRRIEAHPERRVSKTYLATLNLARRL